MGTNGHQSSIPALATGSSVRYRHDRIVLGKVLRIYPANDDNRPNIMVKWSDGRIKSYFATELRVA